MQEVMELLRVTRRYQGGEHYHCLVVRPGQEEVDQVVAEGLPRRTENVWSKHHAAPAIEIGLLSAHEPLGVGERRGDEASDVPRVVAAGMDMGSALDLRVDDGLFFTTRTGSLCACCLVTFLLGSS